MKYNRLAVMLLASASVLPIQLSHAVAQTCSDTTMVEATPTTRFTINTDGTVIDNNTQLMWKSCIEGLTWSSGTSSCSGTKTLYNWKDALDAADSVSYASHSDWRVPNVKELMSIVETRCYGTEGAINLNVFKSNYVSLWTSTPYLNGYDNSKSKVFWVNFFYGYPISSNKSIDVYAVRLVRNN